MDWRRGVAKVKCLAEMCVADKMIFLATNVVQNMNSGDDKEQLMQN
jgi:hypothetical protein